jgi:hypothetical protein
MSKGGSALERTQLQTIDPYEFEHFVAELWEEQGWETDVSQGSNDMGVDVVAEKSDGLMDQKAVIQAKRYGEGNKVGRPKIQQYHALKQQDTEADAAVVVTTSEFTRGAEEWAGEHNVKLVDGGDLVDIVDDTGRYDLLNEYVQTQSTGDESTDSDSSSSSTSSTSSMALDDDSDYLGFVILACAAQVAGVVLAIQPAAVPAITGNQAAWIWALGWLAQPVVVLADASELHQRGADFKPSRIGWPIFVFMIPVLGGLMYLRKRV